MTNLNYYHKELIKGKLADKGVKITFDVLIQIDYYLQSMKTLDSKHIDIIVNNIVKEGIK